MTDTQSSASVKDPSQKGLGKKCITLWTHPPAPCCLHLQRCQSVRSMRSGGSFWSWPWWDSSSSSSWSSLCCCTDTAASTRPVAQVCVSEVNLNFIPLFMFRWPFIGRGGDVINNSVVDLQFGSQLIIRRYCHTKADIL